MNTAFNRVQPYAIETNGLISVGATSTLVLPRRPTRAYVYIQNLSGRDTWINWGNPAVIGASILLSKNAIYEPIAFPSEELYALRPAGPGNLFVIEGT